MTRGYYPGVAAGRKDFQRRTVEYVFRRLYTDPAPAGRFLVADEVGSGKTLVARGLIARAVDDLRGRPAQVNIVYVCSNAGVARQNLDRLSVPVVGKTALASRLTLLPYSRHGLRRSPINLISLTPGTSFEFASALGGHGRAGRAR